jgi:hypothetical protein
MTYARQVRAIVEEYMTAHATDVCESHKVAEWAIQRRLWMEHPGAMVNRCAEAISRSLREEMIAGNVRAKHVVRLLKDGIQMTLWADMRTASRDHMQLAFQQRRQQIAADCAQLKIDVCYYNRHLNPEAPIQISFDFRDG